MNRKKTLLEWIATYIDRLRSNFGALLYNNVYSTVQYVTVQYSSVQYSTSWAKLYGPAPICPMVKSTRLYIGRKLIQSPSKRRSYVTVGGLYHRPNWSGPIKLGPTCSKLFETPTSNIDLYEVLRGTILYYTVLNCTVLYLTVLFCTSLHYDVIHCNVLICYVLYYTIQCKVMSSTTL